MAIKQAFWMEEIIADTHLEALQQCPLDVIAWLVADSRADGCATGLNTLPTTPESTAIKVTAGRLWLGTGVHGELLSDTQVDLTAYIPVTAGHSCYATILGSVTQQTSVPVVIPDGSTVQSQITDVILLDVVTGAEVSSGTPPLPVAPNSTDAIVLADVLLTNGMGIIVLGNISQVRKGIFPDLKEMTADINTLTQQMANKSDLGHHHVPSDIDGLLAYLSGLTWPQSSVIGLVASLAALQAGIIELQASKSDITHNHDSIYHKKTGDEIHDGGFQVNHTPTVPLDVVRLMDISGLNQSEVTIAAGSTIDSGYAYIGALTIAWVRGPSTLFNGAVNPAFNLVTPVTFNTVLTYALTTENSEADDYIWDNHIWFQMRMGYGGNQFPVYGQTVDGNISGWVRPVLVVIGTTLVAPIAVSNIDLTLMEASGQVYPKLINVQLMCTNNIGAIAWTITGNSAGITVGAPDASGIVQVSFSALGVYTMDVKATDSQNRVGTKTITLTLNAYAVSTLVINTGNQGAVANVYPFNVTSGLLSYSGGVDPIAWSIQAGSGGTATDLPSVAISAVAGGKTITGQVPAAGTYYVNLRATDGEGTPQVVDKVIMFSVSTYVDPTTNTYCFEAASTYVLMGDGKGMLLKDITAGMYVLTTGDKQHERGGRGLFKALITDVMMQDGTKNGYDHSVVVEGIRSTPGHSWASVPTPAGGPGDWTQAKAVTTNSWLISDQNGVPVPVQPSEVREDSPVILAGNLGTDAHTFYVGATENGPWFLVHNVYTLS